LSWGIYQFDVSSEFEKSALGDDFQLN
jgi:hypothetical protein